MTFLHDKPENTLGSMSRLDEIIQYPSAELNSVSSEVDVFDKNLEKLISKMTKIAYSSGGESISAPQIGLLKRIIILLDMRSDSMNSIALINPIIINKSKNETVSVETCLSFLGLEVALKRYDEITVSAQDIKGNRKEHFISGKIAHLIQHEIDHLSGKTFIDALSPLEKQKKIDLLRETE